MSLLSTPVVWGLAVAQLVRARRYKPEVAGSIPDGAIAIFHGLPATLWPWGLLSL